MNEKSLINFGHSFQIKSIACFMTKQTFLEQVHDIIDENSYDSEAVKWIVKQCKDYFNEYKKPITLDVFKVKTNDIENDVLKITVIEKLKEVTRYMDSTDLDFVKDRTLDFFKNQTLKRAIVKSVEILETSGDFDLIKNTIDLAMKAGTEKHIGHEYMTMIQERYTDMARTTLALPWAVINNLIQGGLAAGELGVIVAPAGVGKTWILSAIGAEAVRSNKTVMHYTLELNESYIGLRYDSIFTGIANQNLKYHKDDVIKKLKNINGNLIIKFFPTKTASVNTISAHLRKLTTFGHSVDLVIVDYADVLRDIHFAKEIRHQLGNIYEDLRGLAGEFQLPIWTASQSNRSSLDEDVIEAQKISESYAKIMTADFVMSLSRKAEDKVANTGRFHIIKNRFGPDGITYPAKVNTNTGKIEIYDSGSIDGQKQQKKIDNRDQLLRNILANKYKDLIE